MIYHPLTSILCLPLSQAITPSLNIYSGSTKVISLSYVIHLPHLLTIYTSDVLFVRLVKSLIFPPKWKKVSLRVSEDRVRIALREDSVQLSMLLVSLCIFVRLKIILSKTSIAWRYRLPFFIELALTVFCFTSYFYSSSQSQCITDTPLLKSCRYLTTSQGYTCIYHCHLGSW